MSKKEKTTEVNPELKEAMEVLLPEKPETPPEVKKERAKARTPEQIAKALTEQAAEYTKKAAKIANKKAEEERTKRVKERAGKIARERKEQEAAIIQEIKGIPSWGVKNLYLSFVKKVPFSDISFCSLCSFPFLKDDLAAGKEGLRICWECEDAEQEGKGRGGSGGCGGEPILVIKEEPFFVSSEALPS